MVISTTEMVILTCNYFIYTSKRTKFIFQTVTEGYLDIADVVKWRTPLTIRITMVTKDIAFS